MMFSILLLLSLPQLEALPDCDQEAMDAGVQSAMNICARREFILANREMNEQYEKTLTVMRARDAKLIEDPFDLMGQPSHSSRLIESQSHWLKFRNHHCSLEGHRALGGSLQRLLYSTCETALTKERTAQLRELAREY